MLPNAKMMVPVRLENFIAKSVIFIFRVWKEMAEILMEMPKKSMFLKLHMEKSFNSIAPWLWKFEWLHNTSKSLIWRIAF
jgi:hypothetical protein